MNKNIVIGAVLLLVILGLGFFFLTRQNSQNTTETVVEETETTQAPVQEGTPASGEAMTTESKVTEVMVENKGLTFTPNEIKVKMGDKVKLTFKVTAGTHDFVIDELGVKTKVMGTGESETVEFVADKKGSYEFYCSVPGHKAAGMKGTLIVE